MTEPAQPTLHDDAEPDERTVADVPWTVGDAVLVLVGWLLATVFIGVFLVAGLHAIFPAIPSDAFGLPVTEGFLILATVLFVRSRHPGAVRRLFGPQTPNAEMILVGLGAGVVALVVFAFGLGNLAEFIVNATRSQMPEVQETFRELAAEPTAVPLLIIGSVVIGPFAEELFYRGMLFPALRKRLPLWPSLGISGVLFGLSHLQTTLDGYFLVLMIIIPLGMFLAWIYERRRTLVVPIAAHAVFNLVQVIFLIRSGGQV